MLSQPDAVFSRERKKLFNGLAQVEERYYFGGLKFTNMLSKEQNAIPIPIAIANVEIERFATLRKTASAKLLTTNLKTDPEQVKFNDPAINCFVFERKDVLSFFMDKKDIPADPPASKAELLMVVFGSHPGKDALINLPIPQPELDAFQDAENKFTKGQPTVIVAGVNFNKNAINEDKMFTVLNTANPALEYPPATTITKLFQEPTTGENKIEFTINFL